MPAVRLGESMETAPLTEGDKILIDEATALLRECFEPSRHRCAAAVRTETGTVYTGINILPDVGVAAVHAEPIAIGQAVAAGDPDVAVSVAVVFADDDPAGPVEVVSACGVCRELIRSIAPAACVIIRTEDGLGRVRIADLLPSP